MEINNDIPDEVSKEPTDSSQLSYTEEAEVSKSVSLAANTKSASNSQCICNKMPALKKSSKPHGKDKSKQIEGTNSSPSKNMLNI